MPCSTSERKEIKTPRIRSEFATKREGQEGDGIDRIFLHEESQRKDRERVG
jgi:hypothetical protein